MTFRKFFAALVLSAVTAGIVSSECAANGVPTPNPKSTKVPLKITGDPKAKNSRLVIPRKFLKDARVISANEPKGSNLRTIIAGIAMSLGAVSLVFLLVRKKSRVAQTAMGVIVVGAAGFLLGDMATADIAPPITRVPYDWQRVAKSQQNVTIEISEKGDAVELILGTYRSRRGGRPMPDLKPPGRSQSQQPGNTGNAPTKKK